jgi:regulator of PEP synthase PpsR (kinase-PPPase family)
MDTHKVVGLITDPQHLALVRRERLKNMGAEASSASYADLQYIQQELRFSLRLCQQYRWPVVNVTGKAVEESASEIINLVAPHPRSIAEKT